MEKECNFVSFDGISYTEVNRIENNNNTYVFLVNLDKTDDFCIKKLIDSDGKTYAKGLDTIEEFNTVFKLFVEKNAG